MNYQMIAYHPNANGILIQQIKNRQAQTLVDARTKINHQLETAGLKSNMWILDNECSNNLKNAMTRKEISRKCV